MQMSDTTPSRQSVHLRLSGFYIAFFSVYSVALPLWPRWLEQQISLEKVGLVLAVSYWLKLLLVPVTAVIADNTGDRRRIIIVLAVITLFGLLLLDWLEGWLLYALVWGLAGATLSSIIPLSDGLTLRAQQTVNIVFGRTRRWGSVSFIVFSVVVGGLVDLLGDDAIYSAMLITALFLVVMSILLPSINTQTNLDKPIPGASNKLLMRFFEPLKLPNFPLLITAATLLMATHAGLYGFSAIHWAALGFDNTEITLFWVIGVVSEIGLFSISGWLIGKFGAIELIAVAALGGMVRWALLGVLENGYLIGLSQVLHALTFGLLYMAFIAYIEKCVPVSIAASAQGLYDSLSMGVLFGIFTLLGGQLFLWQPAYTFYFMAVLSCLGLLLMLLLLRDHSARGIGCDNPV